MRGSTTAQADRRAALGVLALLLVLAVPVMHALTAPATAMARSVAMDAEPPHHAMDAAVRTGTGMDRCDTHLCAVARTDSTPQTAPASTLVILAAAAPAQSRAVSGGQASERAPPRAGPVSRLCIWRT